MKKFLLSIAIFSLFSFKSFGHVDHYANFNYLEYELFRNNKSIGYHKYDFKREGENLSVISEVSFKITKLGVDFINILQKVKKIMKKVFLKVIHQN